MAKDPAALLYIDKWIAATQGMMGDAKGWFLDLILYQYDKGTLPADLDELASICRIRPSEYSKFEQVFKQVLEQKFKQDDEGRLENEFAKEIIQRRKAFKDKRSNAGKWGYVKKYVAKNYGGKVPEEWNFIYEHFDFTIDLKNEQVLKQMLEQIFKLYINVNEDVNGNIITDDFKYELKGAPPESSHTVTVDVPRGTEDMTDEWFATIFDDKYMEGLVFAYRGVNLADELTRFKVKVRGDPKEYGSRDSGGIRNAFLFRLNQIRPGGPPKQVTQERIDEFRKLNV
jgi:uncharacterized protein YdaU (DUF1376 family)